MPAHDWGMSRGQTALGFLISNLLLTTAKLTLSGIRLQVSSMFPPTHVKFRRRSFLQMQCPY